MSKNQVFDTKLQHSWIYSLANEENEIDCIHLMRDWMMELKGNKTLG